MQHKTRNAGTALAILAALTLASSAQLHELTKTIASACDAADHLQWMINHIDRTVAEQERQIAEGQKTLAKVTAAALLTANAGSALWAPLLATIAEKLEAAHTALQTAKKAARTVIPNLGELKGAEQTVYELTDLELSAHADQASATFLGSNGVHLIASPINRQEPKCTSDLNKSPRQKAGQPRTHDTKTTIDIYQAETIAKSATKTTGPRLCSKSGATASDCADHNGAQTNNMRITGGKILRSKKVTYESANDARPEFAAEASAADDKGLLPTIQYVKDKLAGLSTIRDKLSKLNFKAATLKDVGMTKEATFRKIAAAVYLPDVSPSELPNKEKDLTQLVEKHYGNEQDTFDNKVWGTLATLGIPKAALLATDDQKVGSTDNLAQLQTAVAYSIIRLTKSKTDKPSGTTNNKEEENGNKADASADKTEEKKDGDNKTNATDCTGAEEGKCDKTKCDWNAEKKQCKVKEGAAVISYVMKAPLLLALLLS
uniref:Variant surface glycoprotein n=1 Tax=Trypanosoma brucei TaxID=5691 RepID=S5G4F7_9TRYP|nr:variant surface glycoprotein [Trypanosoma brucei]